MMVAAVVVRSMGGVGGGALEGVIGWKLAGGCTNWFGFTTGGTPYGGKEKAGFRSMVRNKLT